MKVIGKTEYGFILDASLEEVALLMGFRSIYDEGMKNNKPTIGSEMNLVKIARTSEFLRTLDETKLSQLKKQLTTLQEDLDDASNIINALTLFSTLKE